MKQHFQRCTTRKEGGDCLDIYAYTGCLIVQLFVGARWFMGSEAAKTDATLSVNEKFVGYIHNMFNYRLLSYRKRYCRE